MFDHLTAPYTSAGSFMEAVIAILAADGGNEGYAHSIRMVPSNNDDYTYYAVDDTAALDFGYIRMRHTSEPYEFAYTIPPWIPF